MLDCRQGEERTGTSTNDQGTVPAIQRPETKSIDLTWLKEAVAHCCCLTGALGKHSSSAGVNSCSSKVVLQVPADATATCNASDRKFKGNCLP